MFIYMGYLSSHFKRTTSRILLPFQTKNATRQTIRVSKLKSCLVACATCPIVFQSDNNLIGFWVSHIEMTKSAKWQTTFQRYDAENLPKNKWSDLHRCNYIYQHHIPHLRIYISKQPTGKTIYKFSYSVPHHRTLA